MCHYHPMAIILNSPLLLHEMVTIDERVLRRLTPSERLERITQLKEELEGERESLERLEEQSHRELGDRIAQQTDVPSTDRADISKLFESEEPKNPERHFEAVGPEMYRLGIQYQGGSVAAPEVQPERIEIT